MSFFHGLWSNYLTERLLFEIEIKHTSSPIIYSLEELKENLDEDRETHITSPTIRGHRGASVTTCGAGIHFFMWPQLKPSVGSCVRWPEVGHQAQSPRFRGPCSEGRSMLVTTSIFTWK